MHDNSDLIMSSDYVICFSTQLEINHLKYDNRFQCHITSVSSSHFFDGIPYKHEYRDLFCKMVVYGPL